MESGNSFYKVFTTKMNTDYTDMVDRHAEALNNYKRTGYFKTNSELAALKNRMADTPMIIHEAEPTIVSFNSQLHYSTLVCCEYAQTEPVA